jgi:SAM-dependent methyltransferase
MIFKKISRKIKKIIADKKKYRDFKKDFAVFEKLSANDKRFKPVSWTDHHAFLNDKTPTTGFDQHYIYHTAWAARVVKKINPVKHVDIGSRLFFAVIASAFVPIDYYDYRPAELNLSNLKSGAADLLALPFPDQSIKSLSCMHTLEHVGLGRYGDKLDPLGDEKAMSELKRVLAPGGYLLVVVPVGEPKIIFNGHRIYSFAQIRQSFSEYELKDFSLVLDSGDFIENADPKTADAQKYGCGCFWFKK